MKSLGSGPSGLSRMRRRTRSARILAWAFLCLIAGGIGAVGLPVASASRATPSTDATPADASQHARSGRRLLRDARILEREGRFEAAERTTQRALALTPDDPQLHRLRARVLDSLGRREEA
ncbi:MAG: tetratricopeptide repeat protein, partial [Deltaproteobacteria bacterium]|nr:tetratricopeptide repeat protein [Deltaproteobacteria bacterium]